jgi:ribonuclease HI
MSEQQEPRAITIGFDGACRGNPGPGGYGAILLNTLTNAEKIIQGREAYTTNNRMELSAAFAGLNALSPGAIVTMIGDSQYVIRGFSEWLPGWKAKGWKGSNKKPVLNVELWQALELAVARHLSVTWQWVRGHDGHELNERVDRIAAAQAELAHRGKGESIAQRGGPPT